jgi:hypothetical protein
MPGPGTSGQARSSAVQMPPDGRVAPLPKTGSRRRHPLKMRYLVILAAVVVVIGIVIYGTMPSQEAPEGAQPSPHALNQQP